MRFTQDLSFQVIPHKATEPDKVSAGALKTFAVQKHILILCWIRFSLMFATFLKKTNTNLKKYFPYVVLTSAPMKLLNHASD